MRSDANKGIRVFLVLSSVNQRRRWFECWEKIKYFVLGYSSALTIETTFEAMQYVKMDVNQTNNVVNCHKPQQSTF